MPKCPYCNNTIDVNIVKSMSAEDIQAKMDMIDPSRLTGKDLEFYNNTVERLAKYGDRTKLTVPQRDWLRDLQKKSPAPRPEPRPQPMEVDNGSDPF